MAEAEQQIDVGGPRADAVQRSERVVRGVGILIRQHVEVQWLPAVSSRAMFFSVLILAADRPSQAEAVGTRLADDLVIERIEGGRQPVPRSPRRSRMESCWPVTIAASPANPGSRCRSAASP